LTAHLPDLVLGCGFVRANLSHDRRAGLMNNEPDRLLPVGEVEGFPMLDSESHKATKPQRSDPERLEELARTAVDCGYHLHRALGPGLLESAYELLFCAELQARGLQYQCQLPVPLEHRGIRIENAFRADILVEDWLLIELKSTETDAPVHAKQLLTYLRLMKLPLGLLINFGAASYKDGVRRIANDYFAPHR
jgi:iron complex transport system substrate-binding protein